MIRFLLFYRLEWYEQRQGLMAAGAALCVVLGSVLENVLL